MKAVESAPHGWILIHSRERYDDSEYDGPRDELIDSWQKGKKLKWHWKLPHPMKTDSRPRRIHNISIIHPTVRILFIEIDANSGENRENEGIGMNESNEDINLNWSDMFADIATHVVSFSPSSFSFHSLMAGEGFVDRRRWRAMERYYTHLMDRLARSASDWVIINSAQERQIYDKYHLVLDLLLKRKKIEAKDGGAYHFSTDKNKNDGEESYCRSYRLRAAELKSHPALTSEDVDLSSIADRLNRPAQTNDKHSKDMPLTYLKRLLQDFTIDYEGCHKEFARDASEVKAMVAKYNEAVANGAPDIEIRRLLDDVNTFGMSTGDVEGLFRFINDLTQLRTKIKRSRSCERLTAIYTQCPSMWRKYWLWKGQSLVEDDLSSCHAVFWIEQFATGEEKAALTKAFEEGKFYELFVDGQHSRKYIKEEFQKWINGDRYQSVALLMNGQHQRRKKRIEFGSQPMDQIVGATFPNFARAVRSIDVCGKKSRSDFACKQMKSEAEIMVNAMLQWAMEHDVVYFPIHDGWLTIPSQRELVRSQVRFLWKELTGVTPFIKGDS